MELQASLWAISPINGYFAHYHAFQKATGCSRNITKPVIVFYSLLLKTAKSSQSENQVWYDRLGLGDQNAIDKSCLVGNCISKHLQTYSTITPELTKGSSCFCLWPWTCYFYLFSLTCSKSIKYSQKAKIVLFISNVPTVCVRVLGMSYSMIGQYYNPLIYSIGLHKSQSLAQIS